MECSSRVYTTHTRIYKRRKGQQRYYIDQSQLEKRALSLSLRLAAMPNFYVNFFFSFPSSSLPPFSSTQQTPSVSKRAHNTFFFSSSIPYIRKSRRKMDINPAGGGDGKKKKKMARLKKKKSYIYFYSPFFFLLHLLLPSLVVLYTERDPENFPGTKDGAPLYLLPC